MFSHAASASHYRRDIDGLRAIAVLSVVFGHADFSIFGHHPFRGGYLGVDIFFVISGYLISKILIVETEAGRFSLLRFYERRARRILPALFLVLGATIPLAWLWMMPDQLENFAKSLGATLVFSANLFFWRDSGYFSEAIELKPLFHLWSLAVEEQFYFGFPLVLWAAHWLRIPRLPLLFAGLLLSLGLAVWATSVAPSASFYLLPTRAWELLAGAVLAHLELSRGHRGTARLSHAGQCGSLAALLASLLLFNASTPHPGLATAVPVAATAGLIWFGGVGGPVDRLLSCRAMVGIGLISYSLYLWHQPLFAFARIYSINEVTGPTYAALIVVAIALAYLTWRFVEQPFRRAARISTARVWIGAATATSMFALLSLSAISAAGFPQRLPEVVRAAADVPVGYQNLSGEECFRTPCTVGDNVQPSIAVIGDSHAGSLARSLDASLRGSGVAARILAFGDIYLSEFPAWYAKADQWNSALERQNKEIQSPEIDTIVLVGRTTLRLRNDPFDNGEGGVESLDSSYTGRSNAEIAELARRLKSGVQSLLAQGKRVLLAYPIPEVGWHVPNTLSKLSIRQLEEGLSTSYSRYLERNNLTIELFDSLSALPNVAVVRPDELLCDTFLRGRCATHFGSSIFYHDDDHLSVDGADLVAAEIVKVLKTLGEGGVAAEGLASSQDAPLSNL